MRTISAWSEARVSEEGGASAEASNNQKEWVKRRENNSFSAVTDERIGM
jgi:hypothetical protein